MVLLHIWRKYGGKHAHLFEEVGVDNFFAGAAPGHAETQEV